MSRRLSRGSSAARRALITALLVLIGGLCSSAPAFALPPGFEDELVSTVSGGPMDTAWTPDGRMLIPTKDGRLRVYQSGALLSTAALDLSSRLCTVGEQGLVGVAVHPNFAFNHWIYLYYIYPKYGTCNESEVDGPVGRLSRFTLSDTNIIDPFSEVVLFDTGARFRDHHTGGGPQFGKDGYLYITVGDAGAQSLGWPQNLGRLDGKVLRLTDSGGIPIDNPFTGAGTARCNVNGVPPAGSPAGTRCQEIYSYGLRNPFRFAMDPDAASTRYFIQDVGQHTWEEVSEGPVSGGNYGWPVREGPCAKDSDTDCGLPPAGMTDPVHWYHHGIDGAAATGGAFVPDGAWPASYDDSYMLADYVFGKIWQVKPGGTGCRLCSPPRSAMIVNDFADIARIVSMRFGPDGALYYTSREGGVVRRIKFVGALNRAPVARMTASPTAGSAPLTVNFDGTASSDPDGDALTYAWDFESDGTVDAGGATSAHTYTGEGTYTATLTVSDGHGGTNSTTTRIDVGNRPPAVTIETPAAGTLFRVGQGFTLHGSASDPEDGSLPASALTWEVERVHATHTHPYLPPTTGNDVPLTAQEPEDLDAAKDSFYRIYLTATDSRGLATTVVRDLLPHKVNLTFNTDPPGLRIVAGGLSLTGPATVVSWENYNVTIDAPNQTDAFGAQWTFNAWSDGGAQSHVVNTPATDASYTATFTSDLQTLTFSASDDTYVRNDMPTSSFGNSSAVDVDNSPVKHALFKFNVAGVAGRSIVSAKLRLFCTNESSVGGEFHRVSTSTWTETTVNWNNSPAHDPAIIASLGRVAVGTWYEVDLKSAITGDGVYSFKALSTSANGASYTSSEGTAGFRPELRVTVAGTGAPDTTPPSAPQGLTATARSSTQVDLNWTASTDDRGVTGYDVYRNGSFLAGATGTSYSDLTVSAGTLYRYVVRARDAANNVSGASNEAFVTTPTTTPHLFDDGFESGDFSRWSFSSGMTIEGQDVLSGLFSARGTSTGQVTYALKQLATPRSELYYRLWFKINDQGGSSTRFARLRTGSGSSGSSILGFYVSSAGKLGYTNYVASSTSPSTMPVSLFLWHELQVRARINGTASEVEVWLDGVRVGELSKTDNLGTESIGRVQIGDSSTGRIYDVLYDDVAVSTGFID